MSPATAKQLGETIVMMNPNDEMDIRNMTAGMNWAAEVVVLNKNTTGFECKRVS